MFSKGVSADALCLIGGFEALTNPPITRKALRMFGTQLHDATRIAGFNNQGDWENSEYSYLAVLVNVRMN